MINLKTKYMGLELKNPIIAGSSGMTNSVKNIKKLEENGAAAVVLKSIFEEQIISKAASIENSGGSINTDIEANNYINYYVKQNAVEKYIELIEDLKKQISIPVIASVHCISSQEWISFARSIENAGADALELNIFILPLDDDLKGEKIEKIYFDIISQVKKQVSIPVAVKIGYYFTGLSNTIVNLSKTGISGLVLFNRFYNPDIDIETMQIYSGMTLSIPEEITMPLRWIALLSDKVGCDLVASTDIHDGSAVIKSLLAGAKCVEIASTLYKNGPEHIKVMLGQIQSWMEKHGHNSIEDFRGIIKRANIQNPAKFERAQFMKYYI